MDAAGDWLAMNVEADTLSHGAYQRATADVTTELWKSLLALDVMFHDHVDAAASAKIRLLMAVQHVCGELLRRFDALGDEVAREQGYDLESDPAGLALGRAEMETHMREVALAIIRAAETDDLSGTPFDGAEVVR